jgi:hypothetical protein
MDSQVTDRLETSGSLESTPHRETERPGVELSAVLALRAGEIVRVRREVEILATLDERGELASTAAQTRPATRSAGVSALAACVTPSTSRACAATAPITAAVRPPV